MRRILLTLGLLSFLSQPVLSQPMTGTPVIMPGVTGGAAPMQQNYTITGLAAPVQSPCLSCPTGGAAAVVNPGIEAVTVPKKHWWQFNRRGYTPVCPITSGGAASVFTGTPVTTDTSRIATPVNPVNGNR